MEECDENICPAEMSVESFHEDSILEHRPNISLYYRTPCASKAQFARKKRSIESQKDYITSEIPAHILRNICFFLNKKDLLNFMLVCRCFYDIGNYGPFWEFLNLTGKHISESALHNLLDRSTKALKLTSAMIYTEEFFCWYDLNNVTFCKLTHLDLSQARFTKTSALVKILSRCKKLYALSLELCEEFNDQVGEEIVKNANLHILNIMMTKTITTYSMCLVLKNCRRLTELNIGWSGFKGDFISEVCKNFPSSLTHLNFSGTRELAEMNDDAVANICKSCPNLIELDLSDNVLLTELSIDYIVDHLSNLQMLSLSRCYGIDPTNFLKLSSLRVLNIYGCVVEEGADFLRSRLCPTQINASPFSTIARPTVGESVTSIWRCRTRDWY